MLVEENTKEVSLSLYLNPTSTTNPNLTWDTRNSTSIRKVSSSNFICLEWNNAFIIEVDKI